MAMGRGIGGMMSAAGKAGRGAGIRGAVAARKAASVAAAAGGPKATNPTAGKPMGMMSNGPAAKAAAPGMMGNRAVAGRKVGDALTSATGKTSKAGRQPTSKKPFGTL